MKQQLFHLCSEIGSILLKNNGGDYIYTLEKEVDGTKVYDVMTNNSFQRFIGDTLLDLSEEEANKYANSLNSVIYFATLPHKLNDGAVIPEILPNANFWGKEYKTLKVSFKADGGGQDHDDEFRYWINVETNTVDYLAYQYATNGGGVRFREAYNPRTVSGIRFQDYVNYEASVETPLDSLPELFEKGTLKELSRVETEEIHELAN